MMNKPRAHLLLAFFCVLSMHTCRASGPYMLTALKANGGSTQRWNLKLQPAFFWATVGLETEYVIHPKVTIALNVLGKIGRTDGKNNTYKIKPEEFYDNGFMAEIIGRYFIQLNKKHLKLAPFGFYVQGSVGYNRLVYFDGATRPFTLHSRIRSFSDPRDPTDVERPNPLIGGIGAGYQIEILPKKIIANLAAGTQANFDTKGFFLTIYISPSLGILF